MSNQEKAVTWGLLALIAWELWNPAKQQRATTITGIDTIGDNIPQWVKQLSRNNNTVDYFRRVC